MKLKILLIISCFVVLAMDENTLTAQSDVYFQINHELGDATFAFDESATNNIGEEFNVSRLEYYISSIQLIHDGGMETNVDDTWILVDAGTFTNVYLGNFEITNLESISFGIGVEEAVNHLNPATYPSDNPLSPQSPSMHWGWAAGYRFVAMEGNSGDGLLQTYEIHALGDANYRITEVITDGTWFDGDLYVAIDGDYTMALEDVSVASGLTNHSEVGEAAELLWNFNLDVFKEGDASTTTSINSTLGNVEFWMAPNPSVDIIKIKIPGQNISDARILITDLHGKEVADFPAATDMQINIGDISAGLYHVNLIMGNQIVYSKKLFINK